MTIAALKGLSHALRGSSGQFELSRVVGFVGGMSYVLGAHVFLAWNQVEGRAFDLVSYCTAFPGGLAIVAGGTAVAVAVKDRNVASAKVIEETGAVPAAPPAGPKVPAKPLTDDPPGGA